MSQNDFSTSEDTQALAHEIGCLKAMVTLMLKGMGQADAGKVIVNMERYIAQLEDQQKAGVYTNTVQQIKAAYRN